MRTAATNHDVLSDKIRFRRIRLCMLLSGLSVFAQLYLFQPLLADLCAYYHVSAVTSSLAVSSSTIGMAVGLFVLAFKADTVSRTRLMGFSLLASSVLTLLSVWAVNFPLLLLANFLKGALLAGVSAVALAYLTEEVNASVIGLAISLYLSGNTLGGMVGRVSAHCWPVGPIGMPLSLPLVLPACFWDWCSCECFRLRVIFAQSLYQCG